MLATELDDSCIYEEEFYDCDQSCLTTPMETASATNYKHSDAPKQLFACNATITGNRTR